MKTAIAGEDANWGRIVMAVGKAGEKADRDTLSVAIGGVVIAKDGERVEGYDEAPVVAHMKTRDITIEVDLRIGKEVKRPSGPATLRMATSISTRITVREDGARQCCRHG